MKQKHQRWIWLIAIVISIAALAIAFWVDPIVHAWVIEHQSRAAKKFMEAVSRWGDWPAHVIAGFLLGSAAWWRGNKKWTRIFVAMLIACALAGALARVIKVSAGRTRPTVKIEKVWAGPSLSPKLHAFPSGHTASTTAFFGLLFLASWKIGLACSPIPLLIAASRIYVGAHYLSDVVAAALLGILAAYLVARLMRLQIGNRQSQADR